MTDFYYLILFVSNYLKKDEEIKDRGNDCIDKNHRPVG